MRDTSFQQFCDFFAAWEKQFLGDARFTRRSLELPLGTWGESLEFGRPQSIRGRTMEAGILYHHCPVNQYTLQALIDFFQQKTHRIAQRYAWNVYKRGLYSVSLKCIILSFGI